MAKFQLSTSLVVDLQGYVAIAALLPSANSPNITAFTATLYA